VIYSQIDPHLTSAHQQLHGGARFHPNAGCRIIMNPQEKLSPARGSSQFPGTSRRIPEEEPQSWVPLLSAHQQESTL
jgi:hypothetical protein